MYPSRLSYYSTQQYWRPEFVLILTMDRENVCHYWDYSGHNHSLFLAERPRGCVRETHLVRLFSITIIPISRVALFGYYSSSLTIFFPSLLVMVPYSVSYDDIRIIRSLNAYVKSLLKISTLRFNLTNNAWNCRTTSRPLRESLVTWGNRKHLVDIRFRRSSLQMRAVFDQYKSI